MGNPVSLLTVTLSATFGLAIFSTAMLKGWKGWLELRRLELQQGSGRERGRGSVDMRELKERVRKLEAIATGVDT